MTTEEKKREELIQAIADMLRVSPFTFEYKVKKKPQGIKIVHEVTQEEMDCLVAQYKKKKNKNKD